MEGNILTPEKLANYFDHTQLKAYASDQDIRKLCDEAMQYGFKMVAVNSVQTQLCRRFLDGSAVHVGAAISFPLGQTTVETKVFETKNAIENGADEIDYVVNLTQVKNGDWNYIENEMERVVAVCREAQVISKVIFENCYLEKQEIEQLAQIAKKVRPDFIKTSTGFGTGGATAEDVMRMKQIVGNDVEVKAAGGIRSWETCQAMLKAGATRIGTSSGIKILEEFQRERSEVQA